jgi:hypothetical protein
MGLKYTARIRVGLVTSSPELRAAATNFAEYIKGETLATELTFEPITSVEPVDLKVGEYAGQLFVMHIT